jgi:hypothetical protein
MSAASSTENSQLANDIRFSMTRHILKPSNHWREEVRVIQLFYNGNDLSLLSHSCVLAYYLNIT